MIEAAVMEAAETGEEEQIKDDSHAGDVGRLDSAVNQWLIRPIDSCSPL